MTVPRKGTSSFSATLPAHAGCVPIGAGVTLDWAITGGTGSFTGAGGSGALAILTIDELTQSGFEQWTGSITVASYSFDTLPPSFIGAYSKVVIAKGRARHARIRYSVTATDAVDGSVPTTCAPASGAPFRIGRTRVRCTATDNSANTATIGFTVTVRRR